MLYYVGDDVPLTALPQIPQQQQQQQQKKKTKGGGVGFDRRTPPRRIPILSHDDVFSMLRETMERNLSWREVLAEQEARFRHLSAEASAYLIDARSDEDLPPAVRARLRTLDICGMDEGRTQKQQNNDDSGEKVGGAGRTPEQPPPTAAIRCSQGTITVDERQGCLALEAVTPRRRSMRAAKVHPERENWIKELRKKERTKRTKRKRRRRAVTLKPF